MNKCEARAMGYERGFHIASWQDLPEIGRTYWTESYGEVTPKSDDECWDLVESFAYEAESDDRQFSPFEFTVLNFNKCGDRAEELWEAYEDGIVKGIQTNIAQRRKAYSA